MDQCIVSPLMGMHNGLTLFGAAQFLVRTIEEPVKDSVGVHIGISYLATEQFWVKASKNFWKMWRYWYNSRSIDIKSLYLAMDIIFRLQSKIQLITYHSPSLQPQLWPLIHFWDSLCGPNTMVFSSLSCSSLLVSFPYLHPMFGFTVVSLFSGSVASSVCIQCGHSLLRLPCYSIHLDSCNNGMSTHLVTVAPVFPT